MYRWRFASRELWPGFGFTGQLGQLWQACKLPFNENRQEGFELFSPA